jgi:S1-C subfamily serine protease
MKIQMKNEQMLYTSVSIRTNNGSGSGVIIHSQPSADGNPAITVVLTAKHVIKNAKKPRIRVYPDETEFKAKVIKRSKKYDLALMAFEGYHPYVAKLPNDYTLRVYEKMYKMGAGHSDDPYPGEGIITLVEDDRMQIDCGIVFGDSGGPVFIKDDDDYILVGIITMVGMLNEDTPVYHQGIAHNNTAIWEFLTE